MRIFLTGASGFVGSAVVRALVANGHTVTGLVRRADSVPFVEGLGATAALGNLDTPSALADLANAHDAVVHTAFTHDFTRFGESCAADHRVILAMGEALAHSNRPLIVTSGMGILGAATDGSPRDERARPHATGSLHARSATEVAADAAAVAGARVFVVRLPPSVHGEGDHGFVPMLMARAREAARSAYAGEGRNVWSAVHRHDAAALYASLVDAAFDAQRANALAANEGVHEPSATRVHAVAETGIPFRDIAQRIGDRLGVPTVSLSEAAATAHFDWFAPMARMDAHGSSAWTRAVLNWAPSGPGLLEDIAHPSYDMRPPDHP